MNDFMSAILAGFMIGIAGLVSSNIDNPIIAAAVFAVGLVIIVIEKLNLFTGKIGYAKTLKDFGKCALILFGNLIGTAIIAFSTTNTINVMENKMAVVPLLTLFKGIWCGFLMFSAVDSFKKSNKLTPVIMCVMTFIIAKFNHCVADLFYIFAERSFTFETLYYIIIVIIGNTIGGQLYKLRKESGPVVSI